MIWEIVYWLFLIPLAIWGLHKYLDTALLEYHS